MVTDELVPVMMPGLIVQLPAGNPLNTTLPVGNAQLGWVMAPTIGADEVIGCVLIVTIAVTDTHPAGLMAVTL
jgi:hypothetical protein